MATGSFGPAILQTGIAPLNAAIMVHTGAVVIDHLPHGTYFHVSADAVDMSFADRMKCIGYESIIGLSIATVATIINVSDTRSFSHLDDSCFTNGRWR